MGLNNLKLSQKSLLPLGIMGLLFAGAIGFGAVQIQAHTQRSNQIIEHADPAIIKMSRAGRMLVQVGDDVHKALDYDGASQAATDAINDFDASAQAADQLLDQAAAVNPADASLYQGYRTRLDAIVDQARAPLAVGKATPGLANGSHIAPADLDKMAGAVKQLQGADQQISALATDILAYNDKALAADAQAATELKAKATETLWSMIVIGALAILAGGVIAVWMTASKIVAPLNELNRQMTRLAQGDLQTAVSGTERRDEVGAMAKAVQVFKDNGLKTRALEAEAEQSRSDADRNRAREESERRRIEAEQTMVVDALAASLGRLAKGDLTANIDAPFDGRYEQIKTDFNAAVASLRSAIGTIMTAAGAIRGGSDEIASASDDLSRRTEQQAASLEETAAALDEITATVNRSAEGARRAAAAASGAKDGATRSGVVVDEAVQAMAEIEDSSGRIAQIIGVIDEIAFQTNLLALNAGVEAARAGDAGRGFAVVAQEVRALAQRSAEAAKEIKDLIASSSSQVERGVKLVGDTGHALHDIVSKVADIDSLIGEIARSSQEQATGLSQVNAAVNQMDQVTQQNAAMVEEATAAAAGLKAEALTLADRVAQFRVGGGAAPRAVQGAAASAPNPVRRAHQRLAKAVGAGGNWDEF